MKKIIFFLLAVIVIFSCNVTKPNDNNSPNNNQGGSQQVDPLRQDLVAEYLMGEDSLDTSGNSNHAFLNGPLPTFNRLGQFRSAYRFDGIDDYLEIRNHPTLHSDRALSISGWVYVEELSDVYQNIFYKVNTPMDSTNMSHREYSLWIHKTGVLHFNSTPKGGNAVVSCVTDSPVVRKKRWCKCQLLFPTMLKVKIPTFVKTEFPTLGKIEIPTFTSV